MVSGLPRRCRIVIHMPVRIPGMYERSARLRGFRATLMTAMGRGFLLLHERYRHGVDDKVRDGKGEKLLPADAHHLVVAEARDGPAHPHEDEDGRQDLREE